MGVVRGSAEFRNNKGFQMLKNKLQTTRTLCGYHILPDTVQKQMEMCVPLQLYTKKFQNIHNWLMKHILI